MPVPCRLLFLALAPAPLSLASQSPDRASALLIAEDSRPRDRAGLAPLFAALHSADSQTVRWAVRGLGRQEWSELVDSLIPRLSHALPAIRAEAVNAIGQSSLREGTARARRLLEDRVALESDPAALGVILRTLGRLPVSSDDERQRTETLLLRSSRSPSGDAALLAGAAHGFHSLYRATAAEAAPSVDAIERLVELLDQRNPASVRRLAMAALVAGLRTDSGILIEALRDPEREVRRLALLAAFNQEHLTGRERVIRRGAADPDPAVRYEALRGFARHMGQREGCAPILTALDDPDPHVALLAIDLLAGCGLPAAARLGAIARGGIEDDAWQASAHALVALARVAPSSADSLIEGFAASPVWWARMYAARAAEVTRNDVILARLARDREANVQEAAVDALDRRQGHGADSLYLNALTSPDYQLLRTAARALDSSTHPGAAGALLGALQRISRQPRETSRDTRMALLTALGSTGGRGQAAALRRYLTDIDPAVAGRAAELIGRWTGGPVPPTPRPGPRSPLPSATELAAMARTTLVFVMHDGGRIRFRLHPFDAPTNVARLVRMAESGWFTGLTFHRVVPNFVVQGGSPGANEYAGDGPFTRDELGLESHVRGTVGVSTRGRDTGDGQIFFNLVDNYRLDHNYTIIATVIEGMDLVDRMLEGAVIDRVEVVRNDP